MPTSGNNREVPVKRYSSTLSSVGGSVTQSERMMGTTGGAFMK
jgi:hypothetical protein